MIRLNLMLLVAVLASAFYLVHTQYESRRLFIELERAHATARQLETDQQRLFEPFYTTKPSGAGLGLGLAICRDLAAEFGGDLQAHNHPEGGACFVLTVPVGPAPDTPKDTPSR